MDKGVHNSHKGHITVSIKGGPDVILKPGLNRLTAEQYRDIRKVKVVDRYFDPKVGLLKDATPPEVTPEVKTGSSDDKPLDRMNKEELIAKATELGLTVEADDTKAVILAKIQTALAA